MAKLKPKSRVSAVIEDEVYPGEITLIKKGLATVKFDDGDVKQIPVEELTEIVDVSDEDAEDVTEEVDEVEEVEEETNEITVEKTISIPKSKVSISSNIAINPAKLKIEEEKQKKLAEKRKKVRVAKATADPTPPIKTRENLLKARLGKVKKGIPHTYRKEQVIVWAQELRIIQNNPEQWKQGCVRAKKKKSAQDYIDGLNVD